MQQQVDSLVKLQRLFPIYPFAAKQIFNEHSMVGNVRFREAIISLAENEKTRHEINQFAKEVNSKNIQVNNLQYLARFRELMASQQGKPIIKAKGTIIQGIQRRPRKRDDDEDIDDKPKKQIVQSKKTSNDTKRKESLSEDEFNSEEEDFEL